MTDETKRIFDAPWKVRVCEKGNPEFESILVAKKTGWLVGRDMEYKTAKRVARLPELYDKLMWAAVQKCPDAFLTLDECRLCTDKKCEYREIVELLRKVRDGK